MCIYLNLMILIKIIRGFISAEPVGYFYAEKPGDWYQISDGDRVPSHRRIPLYSNPQSSTVVKLPNEFVSSEGIVVQIEKLMAVLAVHGIQYERKGNACRAAMLQAEPVSQAYELPEIIEGMEVSIDVSTCDADAGNRYFGTVTEVSELDTAKNGYILLVQDAKPNFDVNGNSPAIPDDWVMVPKEPTQAMINAWLSEVANWRGHVAGYKAALAAAPQHEVK
ncbi:hypothetical protein [Salmonella enterica]|uniref:hypothetical protein n=1 Tax=Salmonella enterica TaxID=28901 RepID=UPI00223877E6|nr:hypothetical protein [Salmonella enterica]MCW6863059.1 hypothetical protein [Salmonella enterica subsp. enterica serovar Montevideo]MCW6872300.1 hypothetical protein [Salmonella enterica subsp. enterica serovar Montevideo]MCW6890333.1 hypothetical protein [Salmonella enterica]MCW6894799.1 hypothetical protein [Salmonella enterica]MCW6904124.1 hypothetical protein [Salmonella enterica]